MKYIFSLCDMRLRSLSLCALSSLLFAFLLLPSLLFAQMGTRSVPMPATGADEEAQAGGIMAPTDEAYTAKVKAEDASASGIFDGIGNPNAPKAKKDNRIVKPNTLGTRYGYDPSKDKRIKSGIKGGSSIDYSEKRSGDADQDIHKSAGDIHAADHDYHKSSYQSTESDKHEDDWKKRENKGER